MRDIITNKPNVVLNRKHFFFLICLSLFLLFSNTYIYAQPENPPHPISATTIRNLAFGAFSQGIVGGTVSIDPYGVRINSGDVILLNLGYLFYAANIEVTANPGTTISITLGPDISLTDGNGHTMILHLSGLNPNTPFVATTAITEIYIGGVLTVGNSLVDPAGNYNGTFSVTFNQE